MTRISLPGHAVAVVSPVVVSLLRIFAARPHDIARHQSDYRRPDQGAAGHNHFFEFGADQSADKHMDRVSQDSQAGDGGDGIDDNFFHESFGALGVLLVMIMVAGGCDGKRLPL